MRKCKYIGSIQSRFFKYNEQYEYLIINNRYYVYFIDEFDQLTSFAYVRQDFDLYHRDIKENRNNIINNILA